MLVQVGWERTGLRAIAYPTEQDAPGAQGRACAYAFESALRSVVTLPFAPDRAALDAILASDALPALAERRVAAFERLARVAPKIALPFRRLQWSCGERRIATQPIAAREHADLTDDGRPSDELGTLALANAGGIVHMGGIALRNSQATPLPAGVTLMPLAQALQERAAICERTLARRIDRAKNRDILLSGSFMNCGVLVEVAAGVRVAQPLQLIWMYPLGMHHAVFPCVLVSIGAGADVTIFERHLGGGEAFVCGISDVQVGTDARLAYTVLQQTSDTSQLRMARSAAVAERAKFSIQLADLGGASVTNTTKLSLQGADAQVSSAALAFRTEDQRIRNLMRIDLRAPNTRSNSYTNIAVTDTAIGRHHEHISAHKVDGRMHATSHCDGLMLSRKAKLEVLPERNAAHDRVSLHQRTRISSIDAETMFYVASRGIDAQAAVKMIALGFFEPAIRIFPDEITRDEVRTALDERIDAATTT